MKRFVEFGGTVALSRLAWQAVFQSDVLIAGRRLSPDAVGVYSVSLQLATLPMQKIMGVVNQVAFPAVARLQGEAERLRSRLIEAVQLLTVVGVALMWGISAVAPEFVSVFLGPKWAGAVLPLQIVALIVPIRMVNAVFSTAVIGVGKARLDLLNSLVCAVVLPAAFYVGTHWGPTGLALSWALAIPLVTAINLPRMAGAVGVGMLDIARTVWRPVAAGLAMHGAVFGCRRVLEGASDYVVLPVLILAGALAYVLVLHWLVPSLRGRLWQLLRAAA
jgi:O-antigen/teichoic acid export membrane protein